MSKKEEERNRPFDAEVREPGNFKSAGGKTPGDAVNEKFNQVVPVSLEDSKPPQETGKPSSNEAESADTSTPTYTAPEQQPLTKAQKQVMEDEGIEGPAEKPPMIPAKDEPKNKPPAAPDPIQVDATGSAAAKRENAKVRRNEDPADVLDAAFAAKPGAAKAAKTKSTDKRPVVTVDKAAAKAQRARALKASKGKPRK